MSILIRGMEMPTCEQGDLVLRIRWDGRVDKDYSGNTVATAVPAPPHGRLIDADALLKKCEFVCTDDDVDVRAVRYSVIEDAPTIIPAEEGET